MTSAEMDELVRRANASGFESIADYAVALERALTPFTYSDGCEGGIPPCRRGERRCRWCVASDFVRLREAA